MCDMHLALYLVPSRAQEILIFFSLYSQAFQNPTCQDLTFLRCFMKLFQSSALPNALFQNYFQCANAIPQLNLLP